ncbi:class I SAM-dependent methyltransferase [Paludibacterium purpuratum]|uniref:Ubiquinone/menaquinone biosynthesis C-methylase UbiE n=1 Tax=Paludibacterium purpuratum TaxID=1144873 RepID=A0A4V6PZ88_9NEIS|nr:class I SAM-dependent methyltransferase [Paludibacterium purpuratum]TDR79659.1 ubiquinone/menaquinone biosynthesis C-methylase UbiE [Paludibacterium purpuratum]
MHVLPYTDPQLVEFYDHLNVGEHDFRFYESLLGDAPLAVLDLGCGTGSLALRLAARGHAVCAVDPAPAMVAVARAKDVDEQVQWHVGELTLLPPEPAFDAITMTGHAFQCLLADSEVTRTLNDMRVRLRPGGRILFETRNPAGLPWRHWTPQGSMRRVTLPDGRQLAYWHVLQAHLGQLVYFESHYEVRPGNEHWVCESQLRFMTRQRLAEHLHIAGFEQVDWYGDWDGAPFDPAQSREIIVSARI